VIDERLLYVVKFVFLATPSIVVMLLPLACAAGTKQHSQSGHQEPVRATLTFATAFLCSGELKFFT
jgi:hypothetical protein